MKAAKFQVANAAIRYTADGTTPTVTDGGTDGTGVLAAQNAEFWIIGPEACNKFRAINDTDGNGAGLQGEYYY
jgi:hypothetical protein